MTTGGHQLGFVLNGEPVTMPDDGASLLVALRDHLGVRSPKDGCSPQGQCGCCTVLVDGQPRVSCVTPSRRVRDRTVTTLEGLDAAGDWADALCATGGSQCGFCTPGIIVRLEALRAKHGTLREDVVRDALKAHLCRCTGWQTIVEAAVTMPFLSAPSPSAPFPSAPSPRAASPGPRDLDAAARRASLEGGTAQIVDPAVALGNAGFADDLAPDDALVAVRGRDGEWVVGETVTEARAAAGKIQGRRTTVEPVAPIAIPEGDFARTLQTSWVEPGYLETDASWCRPGGNPATPLANGGAFGAKLTSEVGEQARRLADLHGRPVRVLSSREDTVRLGPKRPPLAAGIRADGTGVAVVARTPGIARAIASVAPGIAVHEVDVAGPPTSAAIRAAGWAEAAVLLAAVGANVIQAPSGASASAVFDGAVITVDVHCGDPLDEVVLRSYCIGAAHMAYSWVTSEVLTVDDSGEVQDLTVRSFGIVRAVDTPRVEVRVGGDDGPPVNGSDAVFAAVAAAVWAHHDHAPVWPVRRASATTGRPGS